MFIVHGGSGFLGRHLRQQLGSLGEPCVFISRRLVGPDDVLAASERHMPSDLFDSEPGNELIKQGRCLIYLVSNSVPGTFANDPWREVQANVEYAFQTFWRIGCINPYLKVVLVSSGGTIYGNQPGHPTPEHVQPAPVSGYGVGKLMIEEALQFVGRTKNLHFTTLRVANPVGLHQTSREQGIVTAAARAALSRMPLELFGSGRQIRDYVDADDVVDAILMAASDSLFPCRTWNIGSGIGRSVLDMIALVEEAAGCEIKLQFSAARSVDVPYIVLNVDLAARELGWRPVRPISQSIKSVHRALASTLEMSC